MTVIQTQSRFSSMTSGVSIGWLTFVELVAARWRTRRALRVARQRSPLPNPDLVRGLPREFEMTPELRAEEELRAAYRMWFGGDPLGRL